MPVADRPPPPPPRRRTTRPGRGPVYDIRRASGLRLAERVAAQTERDHLVHQLRDLDDQLAALSAERRELVNQLSHVRDRLYPPIPWCHGRRPPNIDTAPLPPLIEGAQGLAGRWLRSTCRDILRRHGATSLRELHGLLHRYGYFVSARHPVSALSDAMRYEVRSGRARRVERGVYELRGGGPPPRGGAPLEQRPMWRSQDRTPLDPDLDEDPGTWAADGGLDQAITNLLRHGPP